MLDMMGIETTGDMVFIGISVLCIMVLAVKACVDKPRRGRSNYGPMFKR
jgi:hypothetical protein